jgi:hypothetical protein
MPGVAGLAVAGMWYLILALVAPVVTVRRPRREQAWRAVWRNFSIAAGMIGAFIATGAALSWAIKVIDPEHTSTLVTVSRIAAFGQNGPGAMLLRVVGVVGGLLLTILVSVQIAATVHRRRKHVRTTETVPGRR